MRRIALTLWLVVLPTLAWAQAAPIPVYVFAAQDASGLTDDATTARVTAAADAAKRLAKDRTLMLVTSRDAARIVIEVTQAGEEVSTRSTVATTHIVGRVAITNPSQSVTAWVGRATLTSGTFSTQLEASIGPLGRSYGENLARQAEDWIKKNRKALQ